jgi:hypothetical protein
MLKIRRGGGGVNMVIVGEGGTKIASSTDGNTWTARTPDAFGAARGVAYGNGLWVAVGSNANNSSIKNVSTSTNGTTWSGQTSNGGITNAQKVAYGKNSSDNGVWVMCGLNKFATSTNGTSWSACATNGGIDTVVTNVAFGKDNLGAGLWIGVGWASNVANNIVKSTDGGNSWATCNSNGGINNIAYCVAYGLDGAGQPLWVAAGNGSGSVSRIATSPNGSTWYPCASNGGITSQVNGVAYGKDNLGVGLWVAVGSGTKKIATSPDGTTWTGKSIANQTGITTSGESVAYGQDALGNWLWVAVGSGGNIIATSIDGTTWNGVTSNGGLTSGACVAFKN